MVSGERGGVIATGWRCRCGLAFLENARAGGDPIIRSESPEPLVLGFFCGQGWQVFRDCCVPAGWVGRWPRREQTDNKCWMGIA